MQKIDENWKQILALLEVPGPSGLFVMGSFAKRVTVYSQQVRALNLVDSLAGMGYLTKNTKVAVIGAGFGGMTVSAGLAQLGVQIAVFEKHSAPAHLQLNCATRYLHPHIYDWPISNLEDYDADLPLLKWQAGSSDAVASKIRDDWEILCHGKATIRYEEEIKKIEHLGSHWNILTSKNSTGENFDIVILCLGFGVERPDSHSYSYWGDLPLSESDTQPSHGKMIRLAGG